MVEAEYSSRLSPLLFPTSLKMSWGIGHDINATSLQFSRRPHCSSNPLSMQTLDSLSSQCLPFASLLVGCMRRIQALDFLLLVLLLWVFYMH
jgi:hypothetical protein